MKAKREALNEKAQDLPLNSEQAAAAQQAQAGAEAHKQQKHRR